MVGGWLNRDIRVCGLMGGGGGTFGKEVLCKGEEQLLQTINFTVNSY